MYDGDQMEMFARMSEIQQQEAEDQIVNEQEVVDYQIREYPVGVIVQKYNEGRAEENNEIFIPNYQRKFVWDLKKQSRFIESIMLDLPVPYVFGADNKGRVEIIDGSQRIRTLDAFLTNKLVLEGLKKLNKLNGFRHNDLPLIRQRRFDRKTIRIIELTDKASRSARKDIFERINTSPTLLKEMEVRKGVYEGKFYDFIKECANNPKFRLLCPISEKKANREERPEMVLRFFSYSDRYMQFDHIVKDFLNDYMEDKQDNFNAAEMALEFENMLDFAEKYFPYGFRKSGNSRSTPRVRFEALAVGINLALKENPELEPNNVLDWLYSEEFKQHTTSDAANSKTKVRGRIEFVKNKLLQSHG